MGELTDRMRAFARRYEPRSPERVLLLGGADRIEELEQAVGEMPLQPAQVANDGAVVLTPELVEQAMGGAKLFPWQRKKLLENLRALT